MNITLSNGILKATVSTRGAELIALEKDGRNVIWCGDPAVWGFHAPILFPICGGLKDDRYPYRGKEYTLKKHGFIRTSEFTVEEAGDDLFGRLLLDGDAAVGAALLAEREEEQAQVVVDLGHRRDGGLPAALREALLDRDRGREAAQLADVGAGLGLDELAGVGAHAGGVAALAGGEEDVEGERGLAGAGDAGHDGERPAGDPRREVAQVVLAGVDDLDVGVGRWHGRGAYHIPPRRATRAVARAGALG